MDQVTTVMLVAVLLLPLAAAIFVVLTGGHFGRWLGYAVALVPAAIFAFFARSVALTAGGSELTLDLPWVPSIGLQLTLRVDGLSMLFALIISGIGLLVVLYSIPYLGKREPLPRFYASLLFFMAAMLGVVLSGNLLGLYVFWELTSIASFILIGYWFERSSAIYGANKSLILTVAGGLSMLAGLILLGQAGGTYDLAALVARADQVLAHPRAGLALVLVLVGALAKSAQVPLHVWLPDAMAAPTPVSAYLHSATMVKAGLFLVARLWPVFHSHPLWSPVLTALGLATLVVGGYLALKQTDLKALLAMSTISQLGLIMSLLGLGTMTGAEAAVFHILNHATFKACLFMVVGIVDHQTGTRDIGQLRGLRGALPTTFVLAALASLSMVGLPPLNGYLSKELFFAAVLAGPGWLGILAPLLAVTGSIFTVAYSLVVGFRVFLGRPRTDDLPRPVAEAPVTMLLPPGILAAVMLAVGLAPSLVEHSLLIPAASAATGRPSALHVTHWHGFTAPLFMSLVAVVAGWLLYRYWDRAAALAQRLRPPVHANLLYNAFLDGMEPLSQRVTRLFITGHLRDYVLLTAVAVTGLVAATWFRASWQVGRLDLAPINPWEIAMALAMVAGTLLALLARQRLTALAGLAIVGLTVALFWAFFRNPDLALTQLAVEAISGLLLLMIFARMPQMGPERTPLTRRTLDAVVAGAMGLMAFALTLLANGTRLFPSISDYFTEHSLKSAGGHNIVNVILVDFRGLDTLFETTVLGVAGVAIVALLVRRPQRGGAD